MNENSAKDSAKENDARPQPQVIVQRSPLVPVLMIVLIMVVGALAFVLALPYLNTGGQQVPEQQPTTAAQLDPAMLITPSGRKLDIVEFGGFVFEITRLAYSNVPRARTVTITVPGNPPQMGVFHIGESFAGGKIRVVEITGSSVVLEAGGSQQVFAIQGADPAEVWDRGSGTQIIPPGRTDAIPDIPSGSVRPPKDPRVEIDAENTESTDEPADDDAPIESIDDLPDERYIDMGSRTEFEKLRRMLPDDFAADFVLAIAIERDTRAAYGLEIKNVAARSYYYAHGLEIGDVITHFGGHEVRSIGKLDEVLRQTNNFRDEIEIRVLRGNAEITFVFTPNKAD